jgi:aldose 1-epimerase
MRVNRIDARNIYPYYCVIEISDGPSKVVIDPAFGNNARSFKVDGREYIWTPDPWHAPTLAGVPLLGPWANRIDGLSYNANGNRYLLNPSLGNLRMDANHLPIHGLLLFASEWRVVHQDTSSVTSRLEFWRNPKWMAQFPFAHAIEITHRLRGTTLEIETAIENLCEEPIPLCIGYHPYFRLDSPRDEWRVHIAAREQVGLNEKLIPTPERKPATRDVVLKGISLDTVFTNLTGEAFTIESRDQRLAIRFGPKYPVAIVYSPIDKPFICVEPMTALTNAFNATDPIPHVSPNETWRESFWIEVGRAF